jgi:hypothetical protein
MVLSEQTIPSKDPMREHTKAYTAGLMDAEGCFSIYKPTPKNGKTTPYQPRIVLSSVELSLVRWLVDTFGGFYTKHVPAKGQVWYQWNINGRSAAPQFLSLVLPYLRIKREEALVLQEFYHLGDQQNPSKRQELMEKIRGMKNRECVTTETLDGTNEDKLTHAYIAGVMDGEGCISAAFTPDNKPMLRIRMGNNYSPLVQLFLRLYGGWFHTQEAKGNTKEFYTWEITKKENKESFLLRVLPYLRIKKPQAKTALELVRLPSSPNRALRKKLCDAIRLLNIPKIQSVLTGDCESAPVEILTA